MQIIFETPRLIVRLPDFDSDAEGFYLLNSDEEIMRYIRPVKTREETDQFLKEIIAKAAEAPGLGRWIVEERENGSFVGTFAIIPIENTELIQLGYALLKGFWGRGYASELTRAGLEYYFSANDNKVIYAQTETANIVSQKVLLKNGFVPESRHYEEEKEILRFVYVKES